MSKPAETQDRPRRGPFARFLDAVEWLGNLLPHPVTLFAIICVLVLLLSGLGGFLGWLVVTLSTAPFVESPPDGTTIQGGPGLIGLIIGAPAGFVLAVVFLVVVNVRRSQRRRASAPGTGTRCSE